MRDRQSRQIEIDMVRQAGIMWETQGGKHREREAVRLAERQRGRKG